MCQNKTHGNCHEKAHGKLCRVKKKHKAKYVFAVYYIFAVCAHGKVVICRVPDRKHTANYRAHGK
jgi:hypothetical protein